MFYTLTHDTLTESTFLNTSSSYAEILTPLQDCLDLFESIGALVTSKGHGTFNVQSDIDFERMNMILETGLKGDKSHTRLVRDSIDTLNVVFANANMDGDIIA